MPFARYTSKLLIVAFFWLQSASDECVRRENRTSFLLVPSSGPTVCLPLNDYIQIWTAASKAGDRERVSRGGVLLLRALMFE